MSTNTPEFMADLDGGVFEQKIGRALSDVALGVVNHGKVGKVTISFDIKQIESSRQVAISHKLSYSKPTAKGKLSEENTTSTPMHVGTTGNVTIFNENQQSLFPKTEKEQHA